MEDARIAKPLLPDAVRWYREFAAGNVSKEKLASRLGVSDVGLRVLLESLERTAVLECLFWRVLFVPSGRPKPLKKSS